MGATLDFRQHLVGHLADPRALFRQCTPRVLVVTDGLDYLPSSGFGLSQFVSTLAASTIHGMTPEVVTASRAGSPGATLPGSFRLDDDAHGVLRARYDVVFLLGIDPEGVSPISERERAAVARFMQAGGGVFATGDHGSLGASLCGEIPRVRAMRSWLPSGTPRASEPTHLGRPDGASSGVAPSDRHAQRLFVSHRTSAGGVGAPHPLLQGGPLGPIEVFPDHPHEGECRIPDDLTTRFALDGSEHDEWPGRVGGGARVAPERVALGVARGDGFARDPLFCTNASLEPRAFVAIAAYDGQRAGVGRVVTDASWHHFVNLDIDGTGAPPGQPAFQIPATSSAPAADTPELQRIRQYFRNLATWLLPRDVRRCLRFPVILEHLARPPLFEELVVPRPETANGDELHEVGSRLVASIAAHRPRFEAEELITDALEDAVGTLERARLAGLGDRFGRLSGRRMGLAAVGALVVSVVEKLSALETLCALDPHATFGPIASDAARFGVRRYVEGARKDLVELDDLLHKIAQ